MSSRDPMSEHDQTHETHELDQLPSTSIKDIATAKSEAYRKFVERRLQKYLAEKSVEDLLSMIDQLRNNWKQGTYRHVSDSLDKLDLQLLWLERKRWNLELKFEEEVSKQKNLVS
ncbi:hypothetical protein ACM66B_003239 [Microbotryomycetes sp. NB124-2]